jgi:hypothetical protein
MMRRKKISVGIGIILWLCFISTFSHAQSDGDGIGRVIKIQTRLHSFVGKPQWLLIIRDLDHNQNIPHLYDIRKGDNHWVAFTYGQNYLITVSNLQFNTYKGSDNRFKSFKIKNFCNLQSFGSINRSVSMDILITGDLSANTATYTCHVSKYRDTNFTVVKPNQD